VNATHESLERVRDGLIENASRWRAVAALERDQIAALATRSVELTIAPTLEGEIAAIDGLIRLGDVLVASGDGVESASAGEK
jgi:hypothetical protein